MLLFEVLMTRILSVTLSYHFAFLTISLAMLGLAAPGVWLSLAPPRPSTLFGALYVSAIALPGAVLAIVHLGAPRRGDLFFWVALILVPMLALGTAVCVLLLRAGGKQIARMYSADLGGAALGALLAVPLLQGLSTPCVVAALGCCRSWRRCSPARDGTRSRSSAPPSCRLGRVGRAVSAPLRALLHRRASAAL